MRISAASGDAKAQFPKHDGEAGKGQKQPRNANDHEQQARVHPAQPSHSVVVPAPELSSIDVAVENNIGTNGTFRKGARENATRFTDSAPLAPRGPGARPERPPPADRSSGPVLAVSRIARSAHRRSRSPARPIQRWRPIRLLLTQSSSDLPRLSRADDTKNRWAGIGLQ